MKTKYCCDECIHATRVEGETFAYCTEAGAAHYRRVEWGTHACEEFAPDTDAQQIEQLRIQNLILMSIAVLMAGRCTNPELAEVVWGLLTASANRFDSFDTGQFIAQAQAAAKEVSHE
jgi:hypothetical protein